MEILIWCSSLKYFTDELIKENQAGFRAGCSSPDPIIVFHAVIEILKARKIG